MDNVNIVFKDKDNFSYRYINNKPDTTYNSDTLICFEKAGYNIPTPVPGIEYKNNIGMIVKYYTMIFKSLSVVEMF